MKGIKSFKEKKSKSGIKREEGHKGEGRRAI